MQDWKKRVGCPPDAKVFICHECYPDLRDALLRRGWVQNFDETSPHFDLKWVLGANSIDYDALRPQQMVNHFEQNRNLTTKVGLTLSLRNSQWNIGADADSFYPRAFDLYDSLERAEFVLNFKFTKAGSILRRFLEHIDSKEETTFSQNVIECAHRICQRIVTDPEDVLDSPELAEAFGRVSAGEWTLLDRVCLDDASERCSALKDRDLSELINKGCVATVLKTRGKTQQELEREAEKLRQQRENETKSQRKLRLADEAEVNEANSLPVNASVSGYDTPGGKSLIQQAREVLEEMNNKSMQHSIDGARNAWIVKPSGLSRGRGIQMIRELDAIFKATELDGFNWICQKYIESPQLVHGYKFDIRQWVLVVDWSPLTVYVWRQPYIRFAGEKYDESCTNRSEYMHLVNNSVVKHMDGFYAQNDELQTSGYMWFRQQYEEWLHRTYCKCQNHHTPFLQPPPYTCESFGVRWEDVKWTAKGPDDEEGDGEGAARPSTGGSAAPRSSSMPASAQAALAQTVAAPPAAPADLPAAVGSARSVGSSDAAAADAAAGEGKDPCPDLWATCVKPQIDSIILNTLLAVQESVVHRKSTVELYGYDFMFSEPAGGEELPRVWLIEVNSSPACDYSTPVTCPLVKKMMEDTAKIIADVQQNPDADTGEWELLQHPHNKQMAKHVCHVKLEVTGSHIRTPGVPRRSHTHASTFTSRAGRPQRQKVAKSSRKPKKKKKGKAKKKRAPAAAPASAAASSSSQALPDTAAGGMTGCYDAGEDGGDEDGDEEDGDGRGEAGREDAGAGSGGEDDGEDDDGDEEDGGEGDGCDEAEFELPGSDGSDDGEGDGESDAL